MRETDRERERGRYSERDIDAERERARLSEQEKERDIYSDSKREGQRHR